MTDIFKLIFEHDLRLDELRARHTDRSVQEVSESIEAFLKPDPTYSKFYLTGTVLPESRFGLSALRHYDRVLHALAGGLQEYSLFLNGKVVTLEEAAETADVGAPIILTRAESHSWQTDRLTIHDGNNIGHIKPAIADVLSSDDLLLYKEKAHHGFDLHLLSKKNIYRDLFAQFQPLVSEAFRFFSINGKKMRSEKMFYFETWTLNRPPHGAEEVFPETVL
ncbi:hypothetical protein [Rhodohalobacter mucosus]|uniref:Uncharacterized protein n=1 Tax=Rhodohalobacter mucosus TaxID=2079485 RepID=A0A316TP05_9BACT|nr:hypothetical protein [Rhodohalobacter mucosus]PWN05391.1 hypothetical protein DDZ15_15100 [Rhodohalobacter mucosus]